MSAQALAEPAQFEAKSGQIVDDIRDGTSGTNRHRIAQMAQARTSNQR
jgi:hypothetical protein